MSNITLTLPDGSQKEVSSGTSALDVVRSIGEGLARAALAVSLSGKQLDLYSPLNASGDFKVITAKSPEGLEIIRHSTAHLMAMAIVDLFPETQLTIGPIIDSGFYYDFDSKHVFTPDDFEKIETMMREISKRDLPVRRREVKRLDAIDYFKTKKPEPYKVEMLEEWTDESVSFYDQGEFSDLCRGPHVPNTGKLSHFKLLSVAGAYWRGDEKRPMLQRIYATAFASKEELARHLFILEEAKKRDHRRLGKELEYFHLEEHSPGMVFWHPLGWRLYTTIMAYMAQKQRERGYLEVKTPEIVTKDLFEKSGHNANYAENIFFTKSDDREMVIKPMNCPCHIAVFRQGIKSFRDLPMRIAEFGKCHRNELAGVMHGLMRVRGFVQDDAHIFCTEEQIQSEVAAFCAMLKDVYADFGFTDVLVYLSTRPEKRIGSDAVWDQAETALADACKQSKLEYKINPGEGAFYGPKLEFILVDSLSRQWQCGTIQVDYNMPGRLGAEYVSSEGAKKNPVMLHRAILGSFERFIGILIEHHAGEMPLWLNPIQVKVLPISEKFLDYCHEVKKKLEAMGIRAEVDERNEKIGYKVRDGEIRKIPYLLIAGEKEQQAASVSVRKRKEGDLGSFTLDELAQKIHIEVESKK